MSYLALYRKFRPDSFDDVKGQEHVVTTLKNQITNNRVGHAYLLCGTRGTGKTTIAKLIAKTMNCENPSEHGPCGKCASCKAIADGSSLNVIEIDAATHSGVDYMRQINETVQYAPAQGKYLVYIIDEAHQLSKGAFNALLKTMEEPPEYVIFILATTDDDTLPITIKSRCQRFDFHRIPIEIIADRMQEIADKENEEADRDALLYIARLADGSMRDALSILDECFSANIGKKLDKDSVLKTVGTVAVDTYIDLFEAIRNHDAETVLETIDKTIWDGKDLTKFADDMTWFLRNMLFLKLSPDIKESLDMTSENADKVIEMGDLYTVEELATYLSGLQVLCSEIRKSSVKRVTLELALIRMMYPPTAVAGLPSVNENVSVDNGGQRGISDVNSREVEALVDSKFSREFDKKFSKMFDQMKALATAPVPTSNYDEDKQSDIVEENIRKSYEPAVAEDILSIINNWDSILKQMEVPHRNALRRADVGPALEYGQNGNAILQIDIYEGDRSNNVANYLQDIDIQRFIAEEISDIMKRQVSIKINVKKGSIKDFDPTSRSFNRFKQKTGLDIKIVESEEDRNG